MSFKPKNLKILKKNDFFINSAIPFVLIVEQDIGAPIG
jgi:hypothetical protein